MADEKKEPERGDEDPRLVFISEYILKTLRIKMEKWTKMMSNDEFKV